MKFIYAVSAFVAVAAAQDLSSLPACGQLCVNNMLGLASSLGCSATDAKCLCGNANFGRGLNDCSLQACGAAVQAQVVSYGSTYCTQNGATLAGGAGGATGGTSASAVTGSAASALASASGVIASAASSASGALASAGSSISGALASASSGALASASSAISAAGSSASSAAASASSAASSATSSGFAMKTAAPFAGAGALGALALLLV